MIKNIMICALLIVFININIFSITVIQKRKIDIERNVKALLQNPRSMFIGNNSIFFVDTKADNIKRFNLEGKLLSVFGRSGEGPNEFLCPIHSDVDKNKLVIIDIDMRHLLIFDNDKYNFNYKMKIPLIHSADDVKIIGRNKLLISGYIKKYFQEYYLYTLDYENNKIKIDPILTSYQAFDCKNNKGFEKKYGMESRFVGREVYCDFDKENYYFIMESNLKVMKIDRKTKKVFSFGKITENYIKPFVSKGLKKAYTGRNIRAFWNEIEKFSHIKKIFVTNKGIVGVIYSNWKDNGINIYLQLYSKDGNLLSDQLLLKAKSDNYYDIIVYFNKSENNIYILDNEPLIDDEYDIAHSVYVYKIKL